MATELVKLSIRTQDGVWETEIAEASLPFQVAYLIREHFGWSCELADIDMAVSGRAAKLPFTDGSLGDAVRFASKPREIELTADVRL